MKELILSEQFDNGVNDFRCEGILGNVSLMKDYKEINDGIFWGLQNSSCIKSHYTQEDKNHIEKMKNEIPLKSGEKVLINKEIYIIKIIGNYSDCAIFEKE